MRTQALRNHTAAEILVRGALAGVAATIAMDVGAKGIVAPTLGINPPGPGTLGRWLGHMRQGRFAHESIEDTAEPVPHEAAIGVAAHYVIGPALAVGYGLALRRARLRRGSVPLGLAYGIATTAFPWFIVYPAYGWGAMGQRGGRKLAAFALLNHVVYGVSLGFVAARLEAV